MTVLTWVDAIQPGDVIRFKSGRLRTAICVSRRPDGRLHSIRFPILRCSWTKRASTIYDRSLLLTTASSVTGAKIDLTRFDVARRILLEAFDPTFKDGKLVKHIGCCETIGVFE